MAERTHIVRVSEEVHAALVEISKREDRTPSSLVNRAVN
jgi:predicted transcriptional regulator